MNRTDLNRKPGEPTFKSVLFLFVFFTLFILPLMPDDLYARVNQLDDSLFRCDPSGKKTEEQMDPFARGGTTGNNSLNNRCAQCHKLVFDNLQFYTYQHSDIVSKNCEVCHFRSRGGFSGRNRNPLLVRREENYQKIVGRKLKNEFLVPIERLTNQNSSCFRVSLTNQYSKTTQSEFYRIDRLKVSNLESSELPPIISDIKVIDLKPGIFDSINISWRTTKFTNSVIDYGSDELYGNTVSDLNLTKNHKMTLDGLAHQAEYHFLVSSTDSAGNVAKSRDKIFFTREDKVEKTKLGSLRNFPVIRELRTYKINNDIFLYINSNQVARFRIDYALLESTGSVNKEFEAASSLKNYSHEGELNVGSDLAIAPCKRCHDEKIEHPVDVGVRGIGTQSGLPLGNGNRMTCETCHSSHGGDFKMLLRMKESELCGKCHIQMAR